MLQIRQYLACGLVFLMVLMVVGPVLANELGEQQQQVQQQMQAQQETAAAQQKVDSVSDQLQRVQSELEKAQGEFKSIQEKLKCDGRTDEANTVVLAVAEKKLGPAECYFKHSYS